MERVFACPRVFGCGVISRRQPDDSLSKLDSHQRDP